jgi:hypothetical protein
LPTFAFEERANKILATDNLTSKPVVQQFYQRISAYIENVSFKIYSWN